MVFERRAEQIAGALLRTEGKWIAAFYFNNTLFRTAFGYHRVLKIATGMNGTVYRVQFVSFTEGHFRTTGPLAN